MSTFIESAAVNVECDFCGHKSRTKQIFAPLDDVVGFMALAIDREYERAVNALGWESAEGGYLGHHFDSRDLLEQEIGLVLPKDDDGRLLTMLAECLGSDHWCQRNPMGFGKMNFSHTVGIVFASLSSINGATSSCGSIRSRRLEVST